MMKVIIFPEERGSYIAAMAPSFPQPAVTRLTVPYTNEANVAI